MKLSALIFSAFFFFASFLPLAVHAIGISVSPATLKVQTDIGKEGSARFTVSNPSKEVGLYSVYPEEFEKFITLIPRSFTLEAGESREVIVTGKWREGGIIRTVIAVEAERLGAPALPVGGGVRLPFSFEVRTPKSNFAAVFSASRAPTSALLILTALLLLSAVSLYTLKRAARRDTL
jgi:hypothetical protein